MFNLFKRGNTMAIDNKPAQEIYAIYQQKPADTIWIDVRQPEEWKEGTIPGAKRIMLGDLPNKLASLDRNKTYVMICRSGARSTRACQTMAAAGFEHLINLNGGMMSWYGAGYPVE